jgi:hypothetical protein
MRVLLKEATRDETEAAASRKKRELQLFADDLGRDAKGSCR